MTFWDRCTDHDTHIHLPRICHQVSESQRKVRPITYTLHKRLWPSSQPKEGGGLDQGASRDVREYDPLSLHLITHTARLNMSISLNVHKKGQSSAWHVLLRACAPEGRTKAIYSLTSFGVWPSPPCSHFLWLYGNWSHSVSVTRHTHTAIQLIKNNNSVERGLEEWDCRDESTTPSHIVLA